MVALVATVALVSVSTATPTAIPTYAHLASHFDDTVNSTANISNISNLIFQPYIDIFGIQAFWGICFGFMFFALFLTQENTNVLVVLGVLVGGLILGMSVMPPEFVAIANTLLIIAIAGLGYLLIMKKVRP